MLELPTGFVCWKTQAMKIALEASVNCGLAHPRGCSSDTETPGCTLGKQLTLQLSLEIDISIIFILDPGSQSFKPVESITFIHWQQLLVLAV